MKIVRRVFVGQSFFVVTCPFARFLLTLIFADKKADINTEKYFFTLRYNNFFGLVVIDLENENKELLPMIKFA